MTTIKALETHYAGCRFRSRLEARWAVFFDTLGIRWEYEPQGFRVGPVWDMEEPIKDESRGYLPDFYLRDLEIWVEVKGTHAACDYKLLLDASIPHWGLPSTPEGDGWHDDRTYDRRDRNGPKVLILGPIPDDTWMQVRHRATSFHKGEVSLPDAYFTRKGSLKVPPSPSPILGGDWGGIVDPVPDAVSPRYHRYDYSEPAVRAAYTAARKARFEHGERG